MLRPHGRAHQQIRYKFITPLFGILFVMEFVFITAAVFIGY